MPTISAYTSDELKREIDRIIREEGRNQAQVGSTALALYAALPAAARRAFLELAAADEEHAGVLEQVTADMSRVLLSARWELMSRRVADEVRARGELPVEEMGEDQIAALAVELTSGPEERRTRHAAG